MREKGPYNVSKAFATQLPEKGWQQLTAVLQATLGLGIVPIQLSHAWIALLAKPAGGWRPIALLCMTYRWLMRCHRPTASQWDRDNAPPWDYSAPGRGADEACFEEELAAEVTILEGEHLAGCLMDLAKFYDTIDISILISAGVALDFPPQLLVIGLDACIGCRQIIMSSQVAEVIAAATGILPGCVLATSFARCFMIPILSRLKEQMEDLTLRVFVDDVKLRRSGATTSEAAHKGATAVAQAAKLFEMAKCKVSDKTVLMASDAQTAKELVQRLRTAGFEWEYAKHSKDLGTDTTCGARRSTAVRQGRQQQAAMRARSVAGLVKQNKTARKLVRPGLGAGMRWGLSTHGASELWHQRMRRTMLNGAAINKNACSVTAFRLMWQSKADPTISEPIRLLKKWYRTMNKQPEMAKRVEGVWWGKPFRRFTARLLKHKWLAVKGPATAMFTTMEEMGWNMTGAQKFEDHNGEEWGAKGEDLGKLAEQAEQRLEAKQWQWASGGRNGGGLENGGADLTVTKRMRSTGQPQDRGLVEAISLGTIWFQQRVAESFGGSDICQRCGIEPASDLHVFWKCICNASIPEAEASSHLAAKAIRQCERAEEPRSAYWLRGLLANGDVEIPSPPQEVEVSRHNGLAEDHQFEGEVATDGSGGGEQTARTRRCAWAAVQLPPEGWKPPKTKKYRQAKKGQPKREVSHRDWPSAAGLLTGNHQTVARAELYAVWFVITNQGGPLRIWSDHLPLVQTWKKITRNGLSSPQHQDAANADLWDDIIHSRRQHQHWSLKLEWVNSHAEDSFALGPHIGGMVYRGNDAADYWAGEEASKGQITDWHKQQLKEAHEEQQLVITRLVAITKVAATAEPKEDKKRRQQAAKERAEG